VPPAARGVCTPCLSPAGIVVPDTPLNMALTFHRKSLSAQSSARSYQPKADG